MHTYVGSRANSHPSRPRGWSVNAFDFDKIVLFSAISLLWFCVCFHAHRFSSAKVSTLTPNGSKFFSYRVDLSHLKVCHYPLSERRNPCSGYADAQAGPIYCKDPFYLTSSYVFFFWWNPFITWSAVWGHWTRSYWQSHHLSRIVRCFNSFNPYNCSRRQSYFFRRKQVLTFHVNSLPSRRFTWNVKTFSLKG